MSAFVLAAVWLTAEASWARVPALRPHRWQLRIQLAGFCALAAVLYFGSVWHVLPDGVHYGQGIMRYASDSLTYQDQAWVVAADLRQGSLAGLRNDQIFGYSKLLGVVFAVVGRAPLAGMWMNGLFYSATLACVFLLGRELFDDRTGAIAMALAAVWPGFLLHEVQTLRWAETTLGIELALLGCVLLITRGWTARSGLACLTGYALLLWDLPSRARVIVVVTVAFSAVLLGRAIWRREPWARALGLPLAALAMVVSYQLLWSASFQRGVDAVPRPPHPVAGPSNASGPAAPAPTGERSWTPDGGAAAARRPPLEPGLLNPLLSIVHDNTAALVATRHASERANHEAPSALAIKGPALEDFGDLVSNLPGALGSSVFAPTPQMLLGGSSGTSRLRRLAVAEAVPYYVLLACAALGAGLALAGAYGGRTRDAAAFLLIITVALYAILGTVVLNAGTLYRLRQPHVLTQIVLAVAGARYLVGRVRESRA